MTDKLHFIFPRVPRVPICGTKCIRSVERSWIRVNQHLTLIPVLVRDRNTVPLPVPSTKAAATTSVEIEEEDEGAAEEEDRVEAQLFLRTQSLDRWLFGEGIEGEAIFVVNDVKSGVLFFMVLGQLSWFPVEVAQTEFPECWTAASSQETFTSAKEEEDEYNRWNRVGPVGLKNLKPFISLVLPRQLLGNNQVHTAETGGLEML